MYPLMMLNVLLTNIEHILLKNRASGRDMFHTLCSFTPLINSRSLVKWLLAICSDG